MLIALARLQCRVSDSRCARPLGIAAVLLIAAALSACSTVSGRVVARGETASPVVSATDRPRGNVATGATGAVSSDAHHGVTASHYDERTSRAAWSDAAPQRKTAVPGRHTPRRDINESQRTQLASAAPLSPAALSEALLGTDAIRPSMRASPTLQVASVALNVPASMTLDRRVLIQLALRPGRASGHAANASDAPPAHGTLVEVLLSGSDFQIEPVSAAAQRIAAATSTEWLWLVTPKKPGRQQLEVALAALTDGADASPQSIFPTLQHTVDVGMTWQDQLKAQARAHADWLWTALSISPLLLVWLYARWRKKHRWWFHDRM